MRIPLKSEVNFSTLQIPNPVFFYPSKLKEKLIPTVPLFILQKKTLIIIICFLKTKRNESLSNTTDSIGSILGSKQVKIYES